MKKQKMFALSSVKTTEKRLVIDREQDGTFTVVEILRVAISNHSNLGEARTVIAALVNPKKEKSR